MGENDPYQIMLAVFVTYHYFLGLRNLTVIADAEAMVRRHEVYNETIDYIAQRENAGAAFVIRPPKDLDMSRTEHDPVRLASAYNTGREEAERRLEELKTFLTEKK